MSISLPYILKPHFVLLELLISLEAFIYYIILMLMYKVKLKPRAKNSSLLSSYNAFNFGLNKEYQAVFIIEFWTLKPRLTIKYPCLKTFYRDII
jgi:hypothetical protein